jgi:hypothetical protein
MAGLKYVVLEWVSAQRVTSGGEDLLFNGATGVDRAVQIVAADANRNPSH